MVLFLSVRGEGKCEINYKTKEKKNFPSFGRFFDHFWSLVCRKRCLGNVSGVRRRSTKQKKVILRKRCKARFLDIMSLKNRVCVGR